VININSASIHRPQSKPIPPSLWVDQTLWVDQMLWVDRTFEATMNVLDHFTGLKGRKRTACSQGFRTAEEQPSAVEIRQEFTSSGNSPSFLSRWRPRYH
jgi:hypothetical protein